MDTIDVLIGMIIAALFWVVSRITRRKGAYGWYVRFFVGSGLFLFSTLLLQLRSAISHSHLDSLREIACREFFFIYFLPFLWYYTWCIMVERDMNYQETEPHVSFIEVPISQDSPAQCGDGRPGIVTIIENGVNREVSSQPGPKIFGGDAAVAKMFVDYTGNGKVDESFVQGVVSTLTEKRFTTGVHRDDHANTAEGKCGCGRCDRTNEITQIKIDQKVKYLDTILGLQKENPHLFADNNIMITPELLERLIIDAEKSLTRGDLAGEALVGAFENAGSVVETVKGGHQEVVAYVNFKPGVTLDKHALNDRGQQAFGVDILAALDRAEAVGVDRSYAAAWILMDSLATGDILAPDASVQLHS